MQLTKQNLANLISEMKKSTSEVASLMKRGSFVIEEKDDGFDVVMTTQSLILEKKMMILNAMTSALFLMGFEVPKNFIRLEVKYKILPHVVQPGVKRLPEVKNTIAITSGKGGVGKTTTALNLAFALKAARLNVAVLDADIYGPSLPTMLGLHERPILNDEKKIKPLFFDGLQVNSIGLMIDKSAAVMYRGPMASNALVQLFTQTSWLDIDFLVIDMPPGTGDIHLTLAQRLPTTGSVIVTTSEEVALVDARRAAHVFCKMGIPIIGLIENMASYTCVNCGHTKPIFGSKGALALADELKVPFLGSLPFDDAIGSQGAGFPLNQGHFSHEIAQAYREISLKMVDNLNVLCKVDYADRIPAIRTGYF